MADDVACVQINLRHPAEYLSIAPGVLRHEIDSLGMRILVHHDAVGIQSGDAEYLHQPFRLERHRHGLLHQRVIPNVIHLVVGNGE